MQLSTPIEKLFQIGPVRQKKLKKLGIKDVQDLLFHFPHRYEDFSNIIPISEVKLNETCCIQGKILEIKNTRTWKRKIILTQAIIADNNGAIKLIWFNQPYLLKTLKLGTHICLAGKVSLEKDGLYISNPTYEKIQNTNLVHTGRIVPVYPETEGLSSRWLRYILKPLLINFKNKIPDCLPEEIRKERGFLAIDQALWQIHFPDSINLAEKARQRFSFEELFFIQLLVLRKKGKLAQQKAFPIFLNLEIIKKFVKNLPFKLTDAQKKSAWQILKDLEKSKPMSRLLEGDVGSGKTVVAVMAALLTAKNRNQTAFMAPTEILAKQHFQKVFKLLDPIQEPLDRISIGLLTGKEDKIWSKKLKNEVLEISRKKLLEKISQGDIDILIGTHALIQDKVHFKNLALVILDEQHRFGIKQRAKLAQSPNQKENKQGKISSSVLPHLLSMSATPIPRTLALTIYGDLDLSLIDEMPKSRKKIITEIINPEERKNIYKFVEKEIKKGRQVFVICPRIEEQNEEQKAQNEKRNILGWAEVKAVKEEYKKLSKNVFPNLKIEMLHGQMTIKEKENIMKNFKNKKIDILVSTSVIEVGIDMPNATVMLIEGAERFGLAQLHQFRGRVGRSKYQSFCFLFTDSPAKKTKQRLMALIKCENGFELAEKDLEIRGPGDFIGARQWGVPNLAMASLKNLVLVEKARETAKEILEKDLELKKYPLLRIKLKELQNKIHFE